MFFAPSYPPWSSSEEPKSKRQRNVCSVCLQTPWVSMPAPTSSGVQRRKGRHVSRAASTGKPCSAPLVMLGQGVPLRWRWGWVPRALPQGGSLQLELLCARPSCPQELHGGSFPPPPPWRTTPRSRRSSSQQPSSSTGALSPRGRGKLGPAIAPGAPWGQHPALPPAFRKGSPSSNAAHPSGVWRAITQPGQPPALLVFPWEGALGGLGELPCPHSPPAPTRAEVLASLALACSTTKIINAHKNIRN